MNSLGLKNEYVYVLCFISLFSLTISLLYVSIS